MTITPMKSFRGCLCAVLILLAAQAARAETVTITGTTGATPIIVDPLGYLANNFLGLLPVSVSFTYDPNAIPGAPSGLGGITYSTLQPLSFQINSYSNITSGMGYAVIDDLPGIPEDLFEIGGFSPTNLIGAQTQEILFSLNFTDSSDTIFSSNALPATWPGTTGFDEVTLRFEGINSGLNLGKGLPAGATFEFVDTLSTFSSTTSPVPEPSTILLFANGLLGLMATRLYKRRLA